MAENQIGLEEDQHNQIDVFEFLSLQKNAISLEIAETMRNKILKRFEAQVKIHDLLFAGAAPYSINQYIAQLNSAFLEEAIAQDKGESLRNPSEKIQHEWDDGEEVLAASIDTHAAYFLSVVKKDSPMKSIPAELSQIEKINQMKLKSIVNFDDEDMLSITSKVRKNISRVQSNATVKRTPAIIVIINSLTQKIQQEKVEPEYKQVPLIRENIEDEFTEIEVYRKQKQRDYDRKEEERKKQEQLKRKLNDIQREQRNQEEELSKKQYTYDSKGDIILVKNVNTEQLGKDVNLELRYNLRKLPSSTKGLYAFEKLAQKSQTIASKKRDSKSNSQPEDNQEDIDKPSKKNKNPVDFLQTGKNLKLAFQGVKQVQNVIIPMGSNFDKIEPDIGVVLEEKGRAKKGQSATNQVAGKLSRQDYNARFSKTSINFSSMDSTILNQNMMTTQNSMLGADLYKQRVTQVQTFKTTTDTEQSQIKLHNVPKLNIDQSQDYNNTLQLSQPINDSMMYNHMNQTQSFHSRDKINIKTKAPNHQSILLSPLNLNNRDFFSTSQNFNSSMNSTSQSFLPNATFNNQMIKTKSQLFLHKNLPKLNEEEHDDSFTLPPLRSQLDDFNKNIAQNNGVALMGEQNQTKIKQQKMPVTQIKSILKQNKLNKQMSHTQIGFKLGDINQSLLKSMKSTQIGFGLNQRSRPYIEKVPSNNKNHLPPPPLGKSLGHGIN